MRILYVSQKMLTMISCKNKKECFWDLQNWQRILGGKRKNMDNDNDPVLCLAPFGLTFSLVVFIRTRMPLSTFESQYKQYHLKVIIERA